MILRGSTNRESDLSFRLPSLFLFIDGSLHLFLIIQKCCDKPGTAANLYFPLYQPKVILEKLALPPPKNLEALLLDAAKPSASSRNNSDVRSGKHISSRASLPPFPWSHTYNGNCRTNSDAVKLLTSRSTCQGQWARIDSSATLGASTDCFTNLELLTYDQSLVPPSTSGSTPWCEWGSPSIDTGFKSSLLNPGKIFLKTHL